MSVALECVVTKAAVDKAVVCRRCNFLFRSYMVITACAAKSLLRFVDLIGKKS